MSYSRNLQFGAKVFLALYLIMAIVAMQALHFHLHMMPDAQAADGHVHAMDMHLAGTVEDANDAESSLKVDISKDSFFKPLPADLSFTAVLLSLLLLLPLLSRRNTLVPLRSHTIPLHRGYGLRPPLRAPPVL